MFRRPVHFGAAIIASLAMTAAAFAQGGAPVPAAPVPGPLKIHASSAERPRVDAGSVVTSVFTVSNSGLDTVRAQPTITAPRGWTVVMGSAPVVLAPGTTDTWLVGVAVPASAPAQSYVVSGALAAAGATVSDSVIVLVSERRAIEVLSIDMPGWVLSGSRYTSRFIVRNRGNVSSTISLGGATSRGTRCEAMPSVVTLAPGASATVTLHVAMGAIFDRTSDDVLELTAIDRADPTVRGSASTRTTVVSSESVGRFSTVPATLALRSIGGASGVSPVALEGAGLLADGKTAVDFSLQAPTGHDTPYGFGERDEYRVNFASDRYSLRLGDNPYGFSELTSSGMLGTGAEYKSTIGGYAAGVYAEHPRWFPGTYAEEGAFLGTKPDSAREFSATAVERQTAGGAVSIGSIGGRVRLFPGASLQLETATSDSGSAAGFAARARLKGVTKGVSYEVGVMQGDQRFAGLARGTLVEDGSVAMRLAGQLSVGASGSVRVSDFATPFSGVPAQRFSTATVNASYGGLAMLEYGWLSRRDDGAPSPFDGTQHGLRASTSLPLGIASVSLSYERGTVDAVIAPASRPYNVITVSTQTRLWNDGSLSLFGSHDDGSTLTGARSGVASAGASLDVRLPFSLDLALSTSEQRATLGVLDGSGGWFSQSDAQLTYRFVGGQSLSLRARTWQNPIIQGAPDTKAIYLEFRSPIRIPVGPARSAGRAEGIIVDAGTGKPLAGALVRLSDQAAVTDKNGRATFSGLEPATHRVSIDATGAAAGALLLGDAFVDIDEKATTPAKFALSVARGGTVHAVVRRVAPANGTLDARSDSMVTVGMEPNVLVALESGRDTIYQSSDERGRLDFGAVAPGKWTLVVMPGELPDHHVFETDRVEVTVAPGARSDVELRLVPQKRTVTFIGHEAAITAKPQAQKQQQQQPQPQP